MLNGYQKTCILIAGVKLGLFAALADGPLSEESLARRLGAHRPSLSRFISALRVLGLLQVHGEGVELTGLGRHMLPQGLAPWTDLIAEEYLPAWSKLYESVATGQAAFETLFGMTAWEHRERNAHLNESFNRVAADLQGSVAATLRDNYDLSSARCLVDIGGGAGYFLASVLQLYPALNGVLFDLRGDKLRLVATDSYRLALRDLQGVSMLLEEPQGQEDKVVKVHRITGPQCGFVLPANMLRQGAHVRVPKRRGILSRILELA